MVIGIQHEWMDTYQEDLPERLGTYLRTGETMRKKKVSVAREISA